MQDTNVEQKISVPQTAKERLLSRHSLFWKWVFREGLSFAFIAHYVVISLIFKFEAKSVYYEDARLWAWIGVVYHFSVEILQILKLLGKNIRVES
jgi:hypothetical protein